MRYNEIKSLKEEVTTRGFKFGFEFECVMPVKLHVRGIEHLDLPLHFNEKNDSSIRVDDPMNTGMEFVSEPLVLNPLNIVKSKKSLISLMKAGCTTNDSCGFHVHYSSPDMNYLNTCWFLLNLSTNEKAIETLTKFQDIDFVNEHYASTEFLNQIRDNVFKETRDPFKISQIFGTSKYQIMRIHPQGTLEWRGPRNFLNDGLDKIDAFFIRLYRVADILDTLSRSSSVTYNGMTITKNDFTKILNSNSLVRDTKHSFDKVERRDKRFSPNFNMDYISEVIREFPFLKTTKMEGVMLMKENGSWKITAGSFKDLTVNGTDFEFSKFENSHISNGTLTGCIVNNSTLINCKISGMSIIDNITKENSQGTKFP